MLKKANQKITALQLLLILCTYAVTVTANSQDPGLYTEQNSKNLSATEWNNIQKQLQLNKNSSNFQQPTYIKNSWTYNRVGDAFGASLAMSGNTLVVGAYGRRTSRGIVYVYTHTNGIWSHQTSLAASNSQPGDMFGWSVAISGDTLVVGAYHEDSDATGVNGDESNNSTKNSGAAYVFTRTDGTWSQQAYLKASNTDINDPDDEIDDIEDKFGWSVSIAGNYIAVGAPNEASNAAGINGSETDNSAIGTGAVYVFKRTSNIWTQQAYIKPSNSELGDWFGFSVAMSGNLLAVGAPYEDSSALGIDGDELDNLAMSAGAAYVFTNTSDTWSQQAYIKASNTDASDQFGSALAISGNTIVVGAYLEDGGTTGVNGNEGNNYETSAASGAAYVFTKITGTWSQQAYLKSSNTDHSDHFGRAVDIVDDTVIVGAYWEDGNNTTDTDNSVSASGAAYVFSR
ncbi:Type IV pilus biogenesis protein PilO, partial [hydrothermal vent metagenome]